MAEMRKREGKGWFRIKVAVDNHAGLFVKIHWEIHDQES